jgi:hypothetical protein
LFSSLTMQLKMVIKSDPMGYNCKKSYVQRSKLSGTLCKSERCKQQENDMCKYVMWRPVQTE